jgi:protein required for attachment to host cells
VHARLFRNAGKGVQLQLQQVQVIEPYELEDDGPSGRMPPDADQSRIDEAMFAKQLAHWIKAAALAQKFEHVFLVADPQALGEIRPQLHAESIKRLVGELPKTLSNAPLSDIEQIITSSLD